MNRGSLWSSGISPVTTPPDTISRAVDTWNMIQEKPTTIVVQRKTPNTDVTVSLPAQTVRLEIIQNIRESNELRDQWVAIPRIYVEMVCMKDHPTIPNTDIQRADLFFHNGRMYEVTEVIDSVPGRLLVNANVET